MGPPSQLLLEELEAERNITYFATSLINQMTAEGVWWDVAKNCIARLGFTDCVIYWLDPARNVLVPKAAQGPKEAARLSSPRPVEIPVGRGVVGTVALTGQATITEHTSPFACCQQDDLMGYTALTVPVLLEEKVVGIIDAQHPEKDFIRPGHLRMLTTIAALCAQKIKGLAMEQAYRQVERKLQEANKHMAETKLLALRMQMSPHFIFNSLTSVNHFILQEDPEQASQLLTKFSRLLRQVLENAKSEWVLLRKELYALQLYLELEQMRCNQYFEVVLAVGEEVNPDAVLLPPLVIHPFVENAIWHGLLHQKNGKPVLHINCWIEENQLLVCVRDNGIGRAASGQLYRNALTSHKLWGIQCIEKRLQIVNEVFEVNARVHIEDLCDAAGNATGTSVTFSTNLQQPWQPFE